MRLLRSLLTVVILGSFASCDRERRAGIATSPTAPRKGVVEIESGGVEIGAVAGQTIFVPAYSSVFIANKAVPFDLAITLTLRNTDRSNPIVITSVRYNDQDGQLVRDYVKKPLRVAPLASLEFFVEESDTSGGMSASFLVEWVADRSVSDPVVEAIMIGSAGTQGISFSSPGRVVEDRAR